MTADGSWKIMVKTPMGPQAGTLDFTTDGSTLTGTASLRNDVLDIRKGIVNGADLSWEVRVKRPLPMTGHFSATVDGDRIAGRAKLGPMGEVSFEGTRLAAGEGS